MKLKRFLAVVSGAALIAGTTHAAVIHVGGYSTATAPMLIVAAAAVCAAAATLGTASDQRRFGLTVALWVGMVGAELFGAVTTGERVAADRVAKAQPVREAEFKRHEARERLKRAEAALAAADERAASQKAGCGDRCNVLLRDATADARAERDAARKALEAVPAPKPESPLADAIGLAPVTLDLVMVGLGATFNVLGAALVAFGAHTPAPRSERPRTAATAVTSANALSTVSKSAKRFANEAIEVRRGQRMTRTAVLRAYGEFCRSKGLPHSDDIGADLAVLFADLGLGQDARGRITGARIADQFNGAPLLAAVELHTSTWGTSEGAPGELKANG